MSTSTALALARQAVHRVLNADARLHLAVILALFIPVRIYLSLKYGIVPHGDGAPQVGEMLGRFWVGDVSWAELMSDGPAPRFLRERSTQLLYPLLLSLQGPIGWSIEKQILAVNTLLGAATVVGAYLVGQRLWSRPHALLAALLTCSLTPLYWIARYGIVDNLFYAMMMLFAAAILGWTRSQSVKSLIWLGVVSVLMVLTRPESVPALGTVGLVLVWDVLRRYWSPRAVTGIVVVVAGLGIAAGIGAIASSSDVREGLLSRAHVAWGLTTSSQTLLNSGGSEFDPLVAKYAVISNTERLSEAELSRRMSRDALEVISQDPLTFVRNIPIRGLALLYPWTYQAWSLAHVGYEAAYTLFLTLGVILILVFGRGLLSARALLAIPAGILVFLSMYGIDNDLKHRNGIFVSLNLVAPLGYFLLLERKERRADERP